MKIKYEDYLDDDDEYYDEENNYRQSRPRKFKDSDRASAGNHTGQKKNIRKRRKEKMKQRESEEYGE